MPWTAADIPDQSGRLALITGGSSGLGLETARALVARGATVILGCRSRERAERARQELLPSAAAGGALDLLDLDLADLSAVRSAAAKVAHNYGRLDLLINNAGVMGLPRALTHDGFERQFGTNHLGHFALTGLLLPALRRSAAPRVVTVSSNAHKFGRINFDDLMGLTKYSRWRSYGQSKLANLLFAFELQRRVDSAGIALLSMAAHPGWSSTNLMSNGPSPSGFNGQATRFAERAMAQSAEHGALPQLFAAVVPGLPGASYIGPDGLGEMKGNPRPVTATKTAYDRETAARLWDVSSVLTGVSYDFS
jgi:protochlorophyllide reductase